MVLLNRLEELSKELADSGDFGGIYGKSDAHRRKNIRI